MTIDTKEMRARAERWLRPANHVITRDNALGEDHMALDVLELLNENDSLRAEVERLRDEVAARRALSMLAPKEMSYNDRSEFDRLKHADIAQGKRIADLIAEHDRLRSDLAAALVSVDAMAERIEQMRPVYEAAVRWRNTLASDPPTKHEAYCGLCNAIDTALAHTAREQAKESK